MRKEKTFAMNPFNLCNSKTCNEESFQKNQCKNQTSQLDFQKVEPLKFHIEVLKNFSFEIPNEIEPPFCKKLIIASFQVFSALFLKGKCVGSENLLVLNSTSLYGFLTIHLASTMGCHILAATKTNSQFDLLTMIKEIMPVKIISEPEDDISHVCEQETFGSGIDLVIDFSFDHNSELKRKIIESLAIGARWVIRNKNLQFDSPEIQCLKSKSISVDFLQNEPSEFELGKTKHMVSDLFKRFKEGKLPFINHELYFSDEREKSI